ncbi:MAG TPA: hypothetical protein VE954_04075 [Oligoflexus sp.]|uniref:hypothetical protein n=1 Tax=Oligoflexus sp. TaxID=1971216 RepID=UPI002D366F84|nr:hypothetical protein [Oligoflexus sp.]HYX32265.1 hypothetical protein [Oligoflexus sp.]
MLYSTDTITRVKIQSSDGAYGDIKDVYFDDISWKMRYFVVDIGTWLTPRLVLISPEAIRQYSEDNKAFDTNLTKRQIMDSPAFDSEKTVSRQHEQSLSEYYRWSPYWSMPMRAYHWSGIYMYPSYPADAADDDNRRDDPADPGQEQDVHLRSFNEVKKYALRATDGDIGELDDLLIEPETWRITHVIADARKWWPGGQVVIDRGLVEDISWNDRNIVVSMTRDEVKNAPPYDRNQGITESYQMSLSHYYRGFKDRVHRMPQGGQDRDFEPHAHV